MPNYARLEEEEFFLLLTQKAAEYIPTIKESSKRQ